MNDLQKKNKNIVFIAIIFTFIWVGFVCSISFMEAWLKFRAPNMTVPVGLSVGVLVFKALNKMEWLFASFISLYFFINKNKSAVFFFLMPLGSLVLQSFWLLPALCLRVERVLQFQENAPSLIHFYYLFLEVIKTVFLFIFGSKLLNSLKELSALRLPQ